MVINIQLHRKQREAEDQEMLNALVNDVTSGALRKRQSAKEGLGKGLDLYDSDEEAEAMLRRIRSQMGLNSKKKKSEFEEGTLGALGKFNKKYLL